MFLKLSPILKKLAPGRFFSKNALPMTISSSKVPIYIYSNVEGDKELLDQLLSLADSGIAEHHISVMPDVHIGKGATVGTVFASSNYVCPNAVGVDIGCGMCAVPVDGLVATKEAG
jgi:tRNA-splicing ligase RtcB